MRYKIHALGTLALVVLAVSVAAEVPQMLNYQGRLTDAGGEPISGDVSITFTIYTAATDGDPKWSETLGSVEVTCGLFSVLLGEAVPIADSVFNDSVRYLGIQVGTAAEITPRTRLISMPYAHRVSTVDGSSGGTITSGVSVGGNNVNTGTNALVVGDTNTVTEGWSSVLGGRRNTVNAGQSTICGGWNNSIDDINSGYSIIGGGYSNVITGNSHHSVIGGGEDNSCSDMYGTIGGGIYNRIYREPPEAITWYATIGGGWGNEVTSGSSVIGGGFDNTASCQASVCGGSYCEAVGAYAFIGGGYYAQAAGDYSSVITGHFDTLTSNADYSMCFGELVYLDSPRRIAFFNGEDSEHSGGLGINRDDRHGGINYPIHVGTDATNGNGAYLAPSGAWSTKASGSSTENFEQLDGHGILGRIDRMSVGAWECRATGERHIWPCAEDFHEQFDVGVLKEDGMRDVEYLAAGDMAGVALAAVKELHRTQQELLLRIEQVERLDAQLAQLQTLVEVLLVRDAESLEGSADLAQVGAGPVGGQR